MGSIYRFIGLSEYTEIGPFFPRHAVLLESKCLRILPSLGDHDQRRFSRRTFRSEGYRPFVVGQSHPACVSVRSFESIESAENGRLIRLRIDDLVVVVRLGSWPQFRVLGPVLPGRTILQQLRFSNPGLYQPQTFLRVHSPTYLERFFVEVLAETFRT